MFMAAHATTNIEFGTVTVAANFGSLSLVLVEGSGQW